MTVAGSALVCPIARPATSRIAPSRSVPVVALVDHDAEPAGQQHEAGQQPADPSGDQQGHRTGQADQRQAGRRRGQVAPAAATATVGSSGPVATVARAQSCAAATRATAEPRTHRAAVRCPPPVETRSCRAHARPRQPAPGAPAVATGASVPATATARSTAAALLRDSCSSATGSESATMPPPACT